MARAPNRGPESGPGAGPTIDRRLVVAGLVLAIAVAVVVRRLVGLGTAASVGLALVAGLAVLFVVLVAGSAVLD